MKRHLIFLLFVAGFIFMVPAAGVMAAPDAAFVNQDDNEGDDQEFVEVVVARVPIPLGTRLQAEYLETQLRPVSNIAVRGGYFFGSPQDITGRIVKTHIAQGQEVLSPMLALDAADLPAIGSDLALHIDNGRVALAVPVNSASAASFAMRPGDLVDVMMSFDLIELDPEFQTPLPNIARLVNEDALEAGENFLFPAVSQGRLELIPEIDRVVEVVPQGVTLDSEESSFVSQIPRRTSQLTIQQAEVLWLGNWFSNDQGGWQGPNNYELLTQLAELEQDLADIEQLSREDQESLLLNYGLQAQTLRDQIDIVRNRLDQLDPDVLLLSLSLQDALTMKWAMEEPGINIDFALRSQGDQAVFVTTAVSLPQLVEQAGLTIPEPSEFGLEPPLREFDEK